MINNTSFTGNLSVNLLNCHGRITGKQTFYCRTDNNTISFNDTFTTLPNGTYIVQFISTDAAISAHQKIIISE